MIHNSNELFSICLHVIVFFLKSRMFWKHYNIILAVCLHFWLVDHCTNKKTPTMVLCYSSNNINHPANAGNQLHPCINTAVFAQLSLKANHEENIIAYVHLTDGNVLHNSIAQCMHISLPKPVLTSCDFLLLHVAIVLA